LAGAAREAEDAGEPARDPVDLMTDVRARLLPAAGADRFVADAVRASQPWPPPAARTARQAVQLAAMVAARQVRLMPRSFGPATLAGCVAAVLLFTRLPAGPGVRAFSAVVGLVVVGGILIACSPGRDPRQEILAALPVRPGAVVLARAAVVLSTDVVLATAASTVVATRAGIALVDVVAAWLGPAALAAAVALFVAVWRSTVAGATTGGALWLLTSATGYASATGVEPRQGALGHLSALQALTTTSTLSLALAATLVAGACLVARPVSQGRAAR
jgi:hypothetical protein